MWRTLAVIISVCFVVAAVFFVQGYQFNGVTTDVVKKSVIYFENGFHSAKIVINNQPHTSLINGEIRLTPGFYDLEFSLPGRYSWKKKMYLNDDEILRYKELFLLPIKFAPFALASDDSRIPAPLLSPMQISGFDVEELIEIQEKGDYRAVQFIPKGSQRSKIIVYNGSDIALIRDAENMYLDEENEAWIIEGDQLVVIDLETGDRLHNWGISGDQVTWLYRVADTHHMLFLTNKGRISFCDEDYENCHVLAESVLKASPIEGEDGNFVIEMSDAAGRTKFAELRFSSDL
ncbi:hypothetical protein KBD59_03670 [Candidatus Gracilibacteria bacterium]|nr:hypothetical protein [Candidatus Gracilibacteria bacterium]